MGVPGLSTQLRPYAQPFVLNRHDSTIPPKDRAASVDVGDFPDITQAIIDGPSLAYYIYYRCLATRANSSCSFADLPTYIELGTATDHLLDELEAFGFEIDSILFDGFLPETKVSIRHERLQKTLLQRKAYRSSHRGLGLTTSNLSISTVSKPSNTSNHVSSDRSSPGRISGLPAPSFLVPAVMESLQRCQRYSHKTKVVPGEADVFCKIRSEEIGSTAIFTNDSDLILLQPQCKVILLNDMDFDANLGTLRGLYYLPCAVAEHLECSDLVKIGYEMAFNPGLSLRQCAARAKGRNGTLEDKSYHNFAKPYSIDNNSSMGLNLSLGNSIHLLDRLDPRISEYVLGCLSKASGNAGFTRMFLLPLIDDPMRASAWQVSKHIRIIAYSLFNSASNSLNVKTIEVDRRGDRVVEDEIQVDHTTTTNTALKTITKNLEEILDGRHSEITAWRIFSLMQVLEFLHSQGSSLPPFEDVRALFATAPVRLSWSIVHLHAKLDGMLYSFRILNQVLEVHLASIGEGSGTEDSKFASDASKDTGRQSFESDTLATANKILRKLPQLRDLHITPGSPCSGTVSVGDLHVQLSKFYGASLADSEPQEASRELQGRRKKTKQSPRSDRVSKIPQKPAKKPSANMYSLLDEA